MRTIPASWQTGTSRDSWLNNRGTIVYLVKILYGNDINLSSCPLSGWNENFLVALGEIRQSVSYNMLPAITSTVGETKIEIVESGFLSTFELNDWTDLYNKEVEIYISFKETSLGETDRLKVYHGVIRGISKEQGVVKLTVVHKLTALHKEIPGTLQELRNSLGASWYLPPESAGLAVPKMFGSRAYGKAILFNVNDDGQYAVINDYPDVRTSRSVRLFYYHQDFHRIMKISPSLFSEVVASVTKINFDWTDMPFYDAAAGRTYITPLSVTNLTGGSNGDNMKDLDKDSYAIGDVTITGSYDDVFQLTFNKYDLDLKTYFDLLLMVNVKPSLAYSTNAVKFNLDEKGWYIIITDTDWPSPDAYYRSIEEDYVAGSNPNKSPVAFKTLIHPSELPDTFHITILIKADYTDVDFYFYELALKQICKIINADLFVKDNFGNGTVQEAISFILTHYLGISSDQITTSFENTYYIDGQITEIKNSFDHIKEIVNEFGLLYLEREDGTVLLKEIANSIPVYNITLDDVLADSNGLEELKEEHIERDIFEKIRLRYAYNPASDKYEAVKIYGSGTPKTVESKWIHESQTATQVASNFVSWNSYLMKKITFKTSLRLIDLEIGDLVTFWNQDKKFVITSKRVDLKEGIIEWEALETPWSTT